MEKMIIYQILIRLFGNRNTTRKRNGTLKENGCGKMNYFDTRTLKNIKRLGITHIWYTGIIRHASQTDYSNYGIPCQNPSIVKGKAGSPYAIADYYDIDPDIAVNVERRMDEFESIVRRTHDTGMKVVIDFIPNHVARQYHSICKPEGVKDLGEDDDTNMHFSAGNNFYYCWGNALDTTDIPQNVAAPYMEYPAKATGNDYFGNRPSMNDWYETAKLNYGIDYCNAGGRSEHFHPIPDTWSKMTHILLFWAAKGIDVFRCDMAEMVPTAFWKWATDIVKSRYPEIKFIGEVYDPSQYRNYISVGFDYLYDKVGMYDCVRGVICGNRNAGDITWQWQATDEIRDHMLYFLENHDEHRIASDFFAGDAEKGVPGLISSALLHQNPFMLYAGQEFGERGMDSEGFSGRDGRTTIFDYWTVDTINRGYFDRRKMTKGEKSLENTYSKILNIANREKAVAEGVSYDLMYANPNINGKIYAFLRKKDKELLLIAANFSEEDLECKINIPQHAFDFLQMNEGTHEANDLLNNDRQVFEMKADCPIPVIIKPYSGRIYKIVL